MKPEPIERSYFKQERFEQFSRFIVFIFPFFHLCSKTVDSLIKCMGKNMFKIGKIYNLEAHMNK
jgi:hypothetical protein